MKITEKLLLNTVKLTINIGNNQESIGTGFIFMFQKDDKVAPVVVTNKHVIENGITGEFFLKRQDETDNPAYGQGIRVEIDNLQTKWITHPDPDVDLAVLPIFPIINDLRSKGEKPFFAPITEDMIPTSQDEASFFPPEQIVMIGYPEGLYDPVHNIPLFRAGILSTPLKVDFGGKKEFIIDAACYPGSSGSPVFVINEGTYPIENGLAFGTRIFFIGVQRATFLHTVSGKVIVVPIPTHYEQFAVSTVPNNLGIVIKSSRILDFKSLFLN